MMGAIEGTRQPIQNFLEPELRAAAVRMDSLEKRFDKSEKQGETNHLELVGRMDKIQLELVGRMDKLEGQIDKNRVELADRMERDHLRVMIALSGLANYKTLVDRMARLEEKFRDR